MLAPALSSPELNARYEPFNGPASQQLAQLRQRKSDVWAKAAEPVPTPSDVSDDMPPEQQPVAPAGEVDKTLSAFLLFLVVQPLSLVLSSLFMSAVLFQACFVEFSSYRTGVNAIGRIMHVVSMGALGWKTGPPPPENEPEESSARAAPSSPGPFTPAPWLEQRYQEENAHVELTRSPAYYVRQAGFELEEHSIWSEDGWELILHRIVSPRRPRRSSMPERGYPILIQHGLFQCSGVFYCNEERSLPFVLAEAGYDVWLANQRACFDAGHRTLRKSDPAFWRWNLRDLGRDIDDIAAFVLAQTSYPKLAFIGHSQGNASAFMALSRSECPELGSKLSCFVAFAPAVFAGPLIEQFPLNFFRRMSWPAWTVLFGSLDWLPEMSVFIKNASPRLVTYFGYRMVDWLFGWSHRTWLSGRKAKMFRFTPTVSSSYNIWCWTGSRGFAKQGCILDPAVEPWFERDTCPPIALFYGSRDYLCDGAKLKERLETVEAQKAGVKLLLAREIEGYEHMIYWSDSSLETVFIEAEEAIRATLPAGYEPSGPLDV